MRRSASLLLLALGCKDEPLPVHVGANTGGVGVTPAAGGATGSGGSAGTTNGAGGGGGTSTEPGLRLKTDGRFVTMIAAGSDGTLYFGSWDGMLYAADQDAELRWAFATNGRVDAPPAVLDDRVMVTSWDGRVYAVALDGSELWSFFSGAPIDVAPTIASDGTAYVVNDAGTVFALDGSGELVAEASLPGPPTTDIVLDGEGAETRLRVGTTQGRLIVLGAGLELLSDTAIAAGDPVQSIALDGDGTAFFGTSAGSLCSVTRDGELSWCLELSYAPVFPPAIDEAGMLYAGATDRVLYAVTPAGTKKWQASMPGAVLSAPALVDGGGLVLGARHLLVATTLGATETLRSELDLGHAPVMGADGRVFAGDHRGEFLAIDSGRPGLVLADAPWPTERGGFRRLGRREP